MDKINSVAQLNDELSRRASNYGLDFQVGGDGTINASVVLLGEAPGENEMNSKIPFSGVSGGVMWTALREQCGLTRLDCYTTNVLKRQAVVGVDEEGKVSKVSNGELRFWRDVLSFELLQLPNIKYVFVMGSLALKALTEHSSIVKWRGSVIEDHEISYQFDSGIVSKRVTLICMFNPAHILRERSFSPIFQLDMQKASRVLSGKYKTHRVNTLINPTFTDAIQWCDKMIDEKQPIAFDIECIAKETACVGFANNPYEGMCINFRDRENNRFSLDEEKQLYKKIQQVLSHPDSKLIAQNGNFDSYWLWFKDRIKVKPLWFDTMLAHHCLYPRLPHDLGFLTSQYTEHPYYKGEYDEWREGGDINTFWQYNIKDCCITWMCHQRIMKELVDQNMFEFFNTHIMRLQPHLTKMTVLGVKCDIELKSKLNEEISQQMIEMRELFCRTVQAVTGEPDYTPNPMSPQQMCELFYDKLRLPSAGRKRSMDADNRKRLLDMPMLSEQNRNLLNILNKYSKEQKFFGTYVGMEVDYDGRIRCDYKQTGVQAAPGRLSSAATLWGSGTNLQNQPARAQKMFITDPGYEFSYVDGSQAEARVVSVIANVPSLRENFERAKLDSQFDVHRANAAMIFKKKYEDIPSFDRYEFGVNTDDPNQDGAITLRFLGKRCVHGLNYRMEAPKLAEVCDIPLSQANEAYYNYHRAFPEIKRWWSKTIETAQRYKQLFTPLGRRAILLGLNPYDNTSDLDFIIAFVPQSTIGDWVSSLIYKCESDPEWPSTARMCLNVHDALIATNKIEDGKTVRRVMRKHGEQIIKTEYGDIWIPFEAKRSVPDENGVHRWSNLEKVKE